MSRTAGAVAALALLVSLAAGCGDIRFGYRQSVQVVEWAVSSYVTLGPRQQQALGEHLRAVRRWHCATQPPAYAAWVRQAAADFRPGLTSAGVEARVDSLEYFARVLLTEATPHIVALARQLTDRQVRELEYNLGHLAQNDRVHAARSSPPDRSGQRAKAMRQGLENWLGALTPEQSRLVDAWSLGQQPVDGATYAMTGLPIDVVRRALRHRRDRNALENQVRTLLSAPDRWWTGASDPRLVANRQQTWQMLAAVATGITPDQRRTLSTRAETLAVNLEGLGCETAGDAESRR